jgi:hypothetical protein
MNVLKKLLLPALMIGLGAGETHAFCGFYVAKAGASLYNEKSEVIMVRDGQRTVITMSNDFKGASMRILPRVWWNTMILHPAVIIRN